MRTRIITLAVLPGLAAVMIAGCQTTSQRGLPPPAQEVFHDAEGRETMQREYNPDGSEKRVTSLYYDKRGNLAYERTKEPLPGGGYREIEISYPAQSDKAIKTLKEFGPEGELLRVKHSTQAR